MEFLCAVGKKKASPSAFGRVLRSIRTAKGMTLQQVADAAGMKWLAVQRLETAPHVNPQYTTILKLAAALDIKPEELVRQSIEN